MEPNPKYIITSSMFFFLDMELLERIAGIEPASKAWQAFNLPLNYIRILERVPGIEPG